jgi:CBS domain-containing protein
MTRDVITVTANEPLTTAIHKLMENHLDRLIVVQRENGHQKPVGILSMTDLAQVTG